MFVPAPFPCCLPAFTSAASDHDEPSHCSNVTKYPGGARPDMAPAEVVVPIEPPFCFAVFKSLTSVQEEPLYCSV